MTDYNKLFENLKKNLEHFKLGDNGEGWFGGFNFEDGKFKDIDWNEFAKKVSDILGYDIKFDENKKEDKKPAEKTPAKDPEKKPFENNLSCNENGCNCKADTFATCAYKADVEGDVFSLVVLIPGETVDNFRISVNTKEMKLKVARRVASTNLPWYAACKEDIVVDLPAGIKTDTLKKNSDNGLLVITGKIAQQKDFETEI